MSKNVNITSSVKEAEKQIADLIKSKETLQAKKEAKLAEYESKLASLKEKLEADKIAKITPIDEEITRLTAEIVKFQKMRDLSIKYEEQLRKMFEEN